MLRGGGGVVYYRSERCVYVCAFKIRNLYRLVSSLIVSHKTFYFRFQIALLPAAVYHQDVSGGLLLSLKEIRIS